MSATIKIYLLALILTSVIHIYECGRFGGGGSRGGSRGGSFSRPSTSFSRPSYSHPSPSHSIGWSPPVHSPAVHSPSPSIGWKPPVHSPAPAPSAGWNIPHRPSQTHHETPVRPVTSRPVHQQPVRPTPPPASRLSTRRPYNQYPTRVTSNPMRSSVRPVGWNTPRTTASYPRQPGVNLPPRPGSGPQGPPRTYYPSTSGHQPSTVIIKNKYNYHYPGYYSLPVQTHYPGYYYSPSYYHYSSSDTGSTALGFFMGYSLARLTTPTYSHYSFYDGYRPRYDHYTVHHYYHNREAIPQQQEIRPNNIVGCIGDSASVCPANTTSLCTADGKLMCVVVATATMPCADNRQLNCVRSTISCVNNTAPECKNSKNNETVINIPCVSNASVYGQIQYVNNTIVVENPTNNTNITTTKAAETGSNITTLENSTKYPITTTPEYSTKYPITTTPTPNNSSTVVSRKKRDANAPQTFCVTVVAVPAEKKVTEGEIFFDDAKNIVEDFIKKAWRL